MARNRGRRTDRIATLERSDVRWLRREVRRLSQDRDILLAVQDWLLGGGGISPRLGFAFVTAHRDLAPVRAMCRLLGCSSSGYYAWRKRPPSARACRDAVLRQLVHRSWRNSRRTYGRRRIHADLKAQGERVSPKRIARLMGEMGIRGASGRPKTTAPTRRRSPACPAPDLVNRDFRVKGRDELWLADITQVPTRAGRLYVAVVLDAWSRLVVGWAAETHVRTELVERALAMAVRRRRAKGVVHHSDRGTQYASRKFRQHCRRAGIRPSVGAPGNPYDNAMCESFFATLKRELLHRRTFANPDQARKAIADFIERFYNPRRRHSALGYDSPAAYERRHTG